VFQPAWTGIVFSSPPLTDTAIAAVVPSASEWGWTWIESTACGRASRSSSQRSRSFCADAIQGVPTSPSKAAYCRYSGKIANAGDRGERR
jgi:hypothetical protein